MYTQCECMPLFFFLTFIYLFIYLFWIWLGKFIYLFFIVVDFVIHWNESAMDLHVFPIPIPPPTFLSTWSLQVFPVHQVQALVSCIQPGLVICLIIDNIHVSMPFSWNIPPSPSPTESKRLFYTSVCLFLFCISSMLLKWRVFSEFMIDLWDRLACFSKTLVWALSVPPWSPETLTPGEQCSL